MGGIMKTPLFCLTLLATLVVAGCGGGSSSSAPPPKKPSTSGVDGTLSKGPVVNAEIRLYRMGDDGGPEGDAVAGPFTTDADGNWRADVRDSLPRPLVVVTTGGSYTDEASGNPVDLSDRSLQSYLPEGSTGSAVTPLTDMLVRQTQANIGSGDDAETALTNARSNLENALGMSFDPLTTRPLSPDSPTSGDRNQRAYTAVLGALSHLANTLDPNADPLDMAIALAEDMSDGSIDGKKDGVAVAVGDSGDALATVSATDFVTASGDFIQGSASPDDYEDVSIEESGGEVVVESRFRVGGQVSGLAGSGLELQNNAGDNLPVSADGDFSFATLLKSGAGYSVTVLTDPTGPNQQCSVSNGSGSIADDDITDISIDCVTVKYNVGGTLSGLEGDQVVLQNNGGDDLVLNADGGFDFSTALEDGSDYAVSVKTRPDNPPQVCSITNPAGALSGADVTNVEVVCDTRYSIGGTITNLSGGGLVLQNNGGDDLSVPASATDFVFDSLLAEGDAYDVTVFTAPSSPDQECTLISAAGTVGTANVTDISISCQVIAYQINVNVTGLDGATGSLELDNNGEALGPLTADGAYAFATGVPDLNDYNVTVAAQPDDRECAVNEGSGTVDGADVTLDVVCGALYSVGGSVTGLEGSGLVLQNNGADDLAISADGSFTFPEQLVDGESFSVTVRDQPTEPAQTCSVDQGTGTINGGDVATVAVSCQTDAVEGAVWDQFTWDNANWQ